MFGKRAIPVFVSFMILASCSGGEIATDGDSWDPTRFDDKPKQFEEFGDAILIVGGILLALIVEWERAEYGK